jgi:hypothetical protein
MRPDDASPPVFHAAVRRHGLELECLRGAPPPDGGAPPDGDDEEERNRKEKPNG